MLHTPKMTEPYIRIFKLSTGEEVIARVMSEDEKEFVIEKPLQMAMGQRGLQFAPFMMMVDPDKKLGLKKDKVVADGPPVKEIEGQYESITTGIALPQKSSIIT
jgi:hypothetical protein